MVIQIDRQPDNVAPNEAFGGKVPIECFFYRICIERQFVATEGVTAVCRQQRCIAPFQRVFRVMADEDVDVETVDTTGFKDMIHDFLLFQNEKSRRNQESRRGKRFPCGFEVLRCAASERRCRHRFRLDAEAGMASVKCTLSKCGFVRHCSKNTGGLSMIRERVTGGKTGMRPNQKKQAKMKADAWYPQPPSH